MPPFSAYIHRNEVLRAYARAKCTASPTVVVKGFITDCAVYGVDERSIAHHVAYMLDKMSELVNLMLVEEHRLKQDVVVDAYDRANSSLLFSAGVENVITEDNEIGDHLSSIQPAGAAEAEIPAQPEKAESATRRRLMSPTMGPEPRKAPLPRVALLAAGACLAPTAKSPRNNATVSRKPLADRKTSRDVTATTSNRPIRPSNTSSCRRHVLQDLARKTVSVTREGMLLEGARTPSARKVLLSPRNDDRAMPLTGLDRGEPGRAFQMGENGFLDFSAAIFSPPPVRREGRWASNANAKRALSTSPSPNRSAVKQPDQNHRGACFTSSTRPASSSFGAQMRYDAAAGAEDFAPTLSSMTRASSTASSLNSVV
jgi:hypothetical protein